MSKIFHILSLIASLCLISAYQASAVNPNDTFGDEQKSTQVHGCDKYNNLEYKDVFSGQERKKEETSRHLDSKKPIPWNSTSTESKDFQEATRVLIVPATNIHLISIFLYLFSLISYGEVSPVSDLTNEEIEEIIFDRFEKLNETNLEILKGFMKTKGIPKISRENLDSFQKSYKNASIYRKSLEEIFFKTHELYIFNFIHNFKWNHLDNSKYLAIRGISGDTINNNYFSDSFKFGFSLDLNKIKNHLGEDFELIDSTMDDWQKDWPNSSAFRLKIAGNIYEIYFPNLWTKSAGYSFQSLKSDNKSMPTPDVYNTPSILTAFQDRPLNAVWNISFQMSGLYVGNMGRWMKCTLQDTEGVRWEKDNLDILKSNYGVCMKFENFWEGRSSFYPEKNTFNFSVSGGLNKDYFYQNSSWEFSNYYLDLSKESKQRRIYSDLSSVEMLLKESRETAPFTWEDVTPADKCRDFDFNHNKKGRSRWAVKKGYDLDRGVRLSTQNLDLDTYPKTEVQGWKEAKRGLMSSLGLSFGFSKKDPSGPKQYTKKGDLQILRHAHRLQIRSDVGFSKYEILLGIQALTQDQENFFVESQQSTENGLIKEINFVLDPSLDFYFRPYYQEHFESYDLELNTQDFIKIDHFNETSGEETSKTLTRVSLKNWNAFSTSEVQSPYILIRQMSSFLQDRNVFDFVLKNGEYTFTNNQSLNFRAVLILSE